MTFPSLEIAGVRTLSELPQWVLWRSVERDGKPTKVPRDPQQARNASTTNPKTWGTFEQVYEGSSRYENDGIGFVFTADDPFIGVDLDHCVSNGVVDAWALKIIQRLDSYTELSPSGTGVHVICRGELTGKARRRGSVECYTDRRFFTLTAAIIESREEIKDVGDLSWIFDAGPSPKHAEGPAPIARASSAEHTALETALNPHALPDADIQQERLHILFEAAPIVQETWERTAAVGKDWSPSEWDLSLANYFVSAGWPNIEIMKGLIAYRRKHGDDSKLDRAPPSYYYARTILTACRDRDRDEAQDMLAPATLENVPEVERKPHVLLALSMIYGIKISKILRHPADPNWYEIHSDRGIVKGEIDMLINQMQLRKAMADTVSLIISKVRPARHDERAQAMLAVAEVGSIGEEASGGGQMKEWIRLYIAKIEHRVLPEFSPDGLSLGIPFYRDGHLWIPGGEFRQWLVKSQMIRVTGRQFGIMMREAGCKPSPANFNVDGKKTSISTWKIPREVMQ